MSDKYGKKSPPPKKVERTDEEYKRERDAIRGGPIEDFEHLIQHPEGSNPSKD